jgi:hypothetical protein
MSDVNLDSSFSWNSIRTGMEQMRSYAANTSRDITREFSGMFAKTIAVTGIISAFEAIMTAAVEIHRESERFRIDAEQLQTIGNAAREINIPLSAVGAAMNRIEINAYKAAQGSTAQANALERLGINADEFVKLKADEKVLALADAYSNATDKSSAYAAIATIVGARNTQLIALLEQGSAAIREQGEAMGKFSDQTVERLAQVHVQMLRITQFLQIELGAALTNFVAAWQTGWYAIVSVVVASSDIAIGNLHAIERALHFDFKGAMQEWQSWAHAAIEQLRSVHDYEQEAFGTGPKSPKPPGTAGGGGRAVFGGDEGEPGTGSGGAADAAKQIKLEEQLAKLRRDNAFAQLDDLSKIEALQRELNSLHLKSLDFSVDEEEHTKALIAEEQKRKELGDLQTKVEKEKADYAAQEAATREKMAETAEKELTDSREAVKEQGLELAGRKDLAERSKIEYEFDQKILGVKKQIKKADDEGLTDVANMNRALVTQLSLEKQAALAAHDKATAEEMAKKAAEERNGVDDEKQNLATMEAEIQIMDLKLAGQDEAARLAQIELDFNQKISQALSQAADLWSQMAKAYADGNVALGDQLAQHAQLKQAEADELETEKQKTEQLEMQTQALHDQRNSEADRAAAAQGPNPLTVSALAQGNLRLGATSDIYAAALAASRGLQQGSPEYERLVQQITAQDRLRELQGRNLSFADQLNRDKLVQWFAQMQQNQATRNANISHQQELDYWGAIAAGRTPPPGNPYTTLFTAPQAPTAPGGPNAALGTLTTQGDQQIDLLQKIVTNTTLVRI